jgi:hypothetical protein
VSIEPPADHREQRPRGTLLVLILLLLFTMAVWVSAYGVLLGRR